MNEKFERAFEFIMENEGGYTEDHAGPTNFGVTLTTLRRQGDLDDDGYQDGDLDRDGDVDVEDVRSMRPVDAMMVYREQWWDRYRYEAIADPDLASKVMDLSVNMGPGAAHRIVQRAVNRLEGPVLKEDGILGPRTLQQINRLSAHQLLTEIKSQAWRYYQAILEKNSAREIYRNGWRNRAYK